MAKEDPVSIRKAAQVRTPKATKIAEGLVARIESIRSGRNRWEEKLARLYRRRYGIRPEKVFPWPDASNLHFGLADRIMRRLKAMHVGLVYNAYPIVTVSARDQGLARKMELFLEWLYRNKMNSLRALMQCVDAMLSFGKGVLKITWNYETRAVTDKKSLEDIFGTDSMKDIRAMKNSSRLAMIAMAYGLGREDDDILKQLAGQLSNGTKDLSVVRDIVMHDEPMLTSVHPLDLIVPSNTLGKETSDFLAHRMYVQLSVLRAKEKAGFYKNIDKVEEHINDNWPEGSLETLLRDTEYREEMWKTDRHEAAELHECFFLHDINHDGVKERCVMTIHIPTNTVLRFVEYPYNHGQWPFVVFDYEVSDGRYYSPRGIVELVEDLQTEINIQHNAKIDAMTLSNSPIGFYARTSGLQPDDIEWIPGQMIPVGNPQTDVAFPVVPPRDISYEREENILRNWAEEIAGVMDSGLGRSELVTEPRTATEIEAVQSEVQGVFMLDALHFQENMKDVHRQVIALWQQFGPDDTEVLVVGEDLPITVSRQELAGGYDLIPTGTPANTNASLRIGRAIQFMQVITQSGIPPNVNVPELVRYIAQLLDPTLARLVVARGGMTGVELEAERQLDEITRMLTIPGYRAEVKETDNHAIHAQVVEQVIQQSGQQLAQTDAGTRILQHGMKHQELLQRSQQGGGLNTPRLDQHGRPTQESPEPAKFLQAALSAGGGQ